MSQLPPGFVLDDGPAQGPIVTPLPMSPKDQAREGRDISASNRDDTRTDIAVRGEGRDIGKMRFDQAQKLRESFEQREPVKRYRTILNQYAAGIGADATPAGDQQLINAYAQMLNPTSTVMLGEYQATEQVDPMVQQIKSRLSKEFGWDGAGRISDNARKMLLDEMFGLTVNANMAYNQDRQYFEGLANQYGYTPNEVVGPHIGDPFKPDIEKQRLAEKGWTRDARGNVVWAEDDGSQTGPAIDPETGGLMGRVSDTGDYRESYTGQGMSGINEGLAGVLGAPVDLATMGLNLIPQGINAAANTDIPTIENPVGGGEWFKDRMDGWGIYGETDDPGKQFARRVGESVGAGLVPAGTAGSAGRTGAAIVGAIGGGAGAATAQQAFPGNPVAEFVGEIAGGGLTGTGLFGAARRRATREIEAAVPTVPQLKQQAGDLYRQAETRGVTAGPMQTQQLADDFGQTLRREGQLGPEGAITDAPTNTTKAFNLINQYAGRQMRPVEMNTVRGVIADGRKSTDASDQRLAGMLTEQFDDWTRPMAPEFDQARDVASRYLQAEDLEKARELAAASASGLTQSGMENALRLQYRGLDKATINGRSNFHPDVVGAIETVNRGTPLSNAMRGLGKLAPRGVVSFGLGTMGPAAAGGAIGGPVGAAAVGGSALALGEFGRAAATRLGMRNADIAELIARNGGKLPEPQIGGPELEQLTAALATAESAKYLNERPKPRGMFGR